MLGELEPLPDGADVGARGGCAEAWNEERTGQRLTGTEGRIDVIAEPDHACAGSDPEDVIGRAAHRRDSIDVGSVCERLLRERGTEDLRALS